ncbi:putative alpha beta-hydrolase [Lyophyllum shimeji]|uniref:Alpha beta-hydrolase n=1 Tax=Lyophyllum shimeji TaxID=47721 RepID=A0A9P3UQ06_LYOSH|nr:putative alpha beta-hydrolase [Lyophyllum shimeji]
MRLFLLATQLLLSLVLTRADDLTVRADGSVSSDNATATTNGILSSVVTKDFISRDGTKIHAQAVGNSAGPHIIFAHGFACTMTAFDPLFSDPKMLATLYMVRYDTRGHGLSGKPLSPDFYTSDRYADDLKAVIDGFSLNEPFFAGWSLGGAISADIAANFPHPLPFSGLIWLGALPYIGDILSKVATPTVLGFLPGMQDINNATLGLQTRIDFVETLSAKTDSVPYDTKLGWVGSTVYLPPTIATRVLTRSQDPTRLLAEGAAGWPLLILHGSADRQINGTAVISNMSPQFKNVESHLIPGAGHILFYDDEPSVARYILSFISRVKSTKPYP